MRLNPFKELDIGKTTLSNTNAQHRKNKTVSLPIKTKIFKTNLLKIDDFDKHAVGKKIHQF